MRAFVLFLRDRGVRSPPDRSSVRWRLGVLRIVGPSAGSNRFVAVEFAQPASAPGMGVIATLYEPMLEGVDHCSFRLRGFERVEVDGTAAGVVQEWLVDVKSAAREGAW